MFKVVTPLLLGFYIRDSMDLVRRPTGIAKYYRK